MDPSITHYSLLITDKKYSFHLVTEYKSLIIRNHKKKKNGTNAVLIRQNQHY